MKMQKKKIRLYLVFVIALFVFVLYFSLKDNYITIINTLSKVKIVYLLLGILFVFISKYLIGLTLYYLAKKEKNNTKFNKMLQIALIYPFFAGITPSSVGGESFEIFYLKETGISYGKSSNISTQKFILYEISLIIVNLAAVLLNISTDIIPNNSLVVSSVTLNFIVNIVILGFLFLLAYNKKFNHFIMNKGLLFLHKIKITKDLKNKKKKLDSYLDNFDEGVDKLRKDKKLFIKLISISILSLVFFILAAVPIARSLNINNISILNIFILVSYAKMMCLLIVTPGNSGAQEYCFIYLFTGLLIEEDIMAYMLIWRFVTYYIPLILGGILAMMWRKEEKNEKNSCIKS